MIDNPCFDVKTKTDCSDRHCGCSADCRKWKDYVELREQLYKHRRYENDFYGHMVDRKDRLHNYHGNKRKIEK